jgi:hypothetical protein
MADAPKFHSASSSVDNADALVADFDGVDRKERTDKPVRRRAGVASAGGSQAGGGNARQARRSTTGQGVG